MDEHIVSTLGISPIAGDGALIVKKTPKEQQLVSPALMSKTH